MSKKAIPTKFLGPKGFQVTYDFVCEPSVRTDEFERRYKYYISQRTRVFDSVFEAQVFISQNKWNILSKKPYPLRYAVYYGQIFSLRIEKLADGKEVSIKWLLDQQGYKPKKRFRAPYNSWSKKNWRKGGGYRRPETQADRVAACYEVEEEFEYAVSKVRAVRNAKNLPSAWDDIYRSSPQKNWKSYRKTQYKKAEISPRALFKNQDSSSDLDD